MEPVFRLFIDEVGDADMKDADKPDRQYLSLTGVIMSIAHEQTVVEPALNILKARIFHDPNIVLHRTEIVYRRPPFECLEDVKLRTDFDQSILKLVENASYRVITVVIDKLEHTRRYQIWQANPYHYCLLALLERYVMWLQLANSYGDVMAESRGKKDNKKLCASYTRLFQKGTEYVGYKVFQQRLTSRELKIKEKSANVAGLQIADLIANPSMRSLICEKTGTTMRADFGMHVVSILKKNKYRRSSNGTIAGRGTKWLP
jgi:hypothetical protein